VSGLARSVRGIISGFVSLRTDEKYWKQGVKLLGKPVTVRMEGPSSSIGIQASLDLSSNSELIITHTIS